ncbi:MAG: radical SAM protein [Thermodesulfobacteriota bacterium]
MSNKPRGIRELWYKLTAPHLDWIQVEVTTHCNARCTYCPNWVLRGNRHPGHMDIEVFRRLAKSFPWTEMVHLQGWGEPLLHPDFFEMARIAKKASCRIGTTTNGTLCTAEACERLVEVGFDTVAFSLAGTDDRQDEIRGGARIESVLRAIEILHRTKVLRDSRTPAVHIAYLALRSRLQDVVELPRLLEGMGVSQVVISTLDLVPHDGLASETLAPEGPEEEAGFLSVLEHAASEGRKRGVDVHYRLASHTRKIGYCTEHVTNAVVVSADGSVWPCVFANVAVRPTPDAPSFRFGNVGDKSLSEIWATGEYRAFRDAHERRNPPDRCLLCPKMVMAASPRR